MKPLNQVCGYTSIYKSASIEYMKGVEPRGLHEV